MQRGGERVCERKIESGRERQSRRRSRRRGGEREGGREGGRDARERERGVLRENSLRLSRLYVRRCAFLPLTLALSLYSEP
jgi:hypothetical protein